MKKITKEKLNQILQQHQLWLDCDAVKGERANLSNFELREAELRDANLRRANLQSANLREANLRDTKLDGADFRGANLSCAYLDGAKLIGADLRHAQFSTNIRDCFSFHGARFTPEALPWLILHPWWAELKDTVQIEHT